MHKTKRVASEVQVLEWMRGAAGEMVLGKMLLVPALHS